MSNTKVVFPAVKGTTNKKVNPMSEQVITLQEAIIGALTFVRQNTYSFRPQPLIDDEGNSTKIEGVEYIDYETDRNGDVVLGEDGQPKGLISRGKAATKRLPAVIEVTYPTLRTFGINVDPVVSASGDVSYEDKTLQLLFEQAISVVDSEARAYLDVGKTPTADDLDFAKIAAKPKAQRASSSKTVDKDSLVAAVESFSSVLLGLGKPERGVEVQVKFFKARCRGAENMDNARIAKFQENLALWYSSISADQQADHVEAFEFLNDKLEKAKASDFDLDELL